jgi:hypothetical protein
MNTLRNAALIAGAGVLLSACLPVAPSISLLAASTAPEDTPAASTTINAGEIAVLHWSGTTNMEAKEGRTMSRDYVIKSSDPLAAIIRIEETCDEGKLNTDWACVNTPRSGVNQVRPYTTGSYTLEATEQMYVSVGNVPVAYGDPIVETSTATVNVNPDVAINAVLPFVTDVPLRTCISDTASATGATMTSELVNLDCSGREVKRLQGLPYFYNISMLDLSNNTILTVEAEYLRYLQHTTSVNLQQSGIACAKQKQIASALTATGSTVLVGQGTSTCP